MNEEKNYQKRINAHLNAFLRENGNEDHDFDFKSMSTIEVLETLVAYLEAHMEHVDISDQDEAWATRRYNWGLYAGISMMQDIIGQITLKIDDTHVIYRYRGRNIRVDRDKFFKENPSYGKISEFLLAATDKEGLETFDYDDEIVAKRYTEEQMAETVDMFLDQSIKYHQYNQKEISVDEDFDEDAFRKYCEEVIPRFIEGNADEEEFPEIDSSKKMGIFLEVFYQDEINEKKSSGIQAVPISMEERIERTRKRFDC